MLWIGLAIADYWLGDHSCTGFIPATLSSAEPIWKEPFVPVEATQYLAKPWIIGDIWSFVRIPQFGYGIRQDGGTIGVLWIVSNWVLKTSRFQTRLELNGHCETFGALGNQSAQECQVDLLSVAYATVISELGDGPIGITSETYRPGVVIPVHLDADEARIGETFGSLGPSALDSILCWGLFS